MSFFDRFFSFLHKPQQPESGAVAGRDRNAPPIADPKPNKNVYDEAFKVEVPDWAKGLNNTELTSQLREHVKCHYAPNFGWKKIMTAKTGPDGNLIPEYDGIAGDCGAIKNFGAKVAQQAGMTMPYKYFDLNNAYRACCDNPRKCPFFLHAENENETVNARRR